MRFRNAGFTVDATTWSFPEIEGELHGLGYRFVGVLAVDGGPDIESYARGDMHDEDLDWMIAKGAFKDLVFWHPQHHIFAELSGWLDDAPTLSLRSASADGALIRTRSMLQRMPRWHSKNEDVLSYLLTCHAPRAGSYVFAIAGTVQEQHQAHVEHCATLAAERDTTFLTNGSMAAHIQSANRTLEFIMRTGLMGLIHRGVFGIGGATLAAASLVCLLLADGQWRAGPMVLGLAGLVAIWVALNRANWIPRILRTKLPGVDDDTPLIDGS